MGQSNIALIYEAYSDRAQISGGAWQTGSLGLSNLRTPYLAEVARSVSLAPEATQFIVDLNEPSTIGGIALGACNVQPTAEARFRAYRDTARTDQIFDSGRVSFPGVAVDVATIEWEDMGFWSGVTKEFVDNGKSSSLIYLPPTPVQAQYWFIEIFDAFNPAGYIEVGRLFMGQRWSPSINYGYDGNSLDLLDVTGVEESRGGVRFYDQRPIRRSLSVSFDYLTEREVFQDVYRIAVRSGVSGQVVVVSSPDDPDSMRNEAFIATMRQLPSLRRPVFGRASTAFVFDEVL